MKYKLEVIKMESEFNQGADIEFVDKMDSKTENQIERGFNLNEGYIQLPITIDHLPPKLDVLNYELLLKDELHCSLVCIKNLTNKYGPDIEKKIIDLFNDFTLNYDIALVNFHNEFRLVHRKERVSVIAMCNISNIDIFYKLLNEKLGISEVIPPMHVTLYTLQPNMGIGVNTDSELQATEIVSPDAIYIDSLNGTKK
ncbi:MAG: hypothetical protein NTU76_02155 [Candidatus Taylorbacteria bacterium]|nr:hypothetical protein [Candidatus Taylorbacteria bacterium]